MTKFKYFIINYIKKYKNYFMYISIPKYDTLVIQGY